ncbi:uncharacterized protein LOC110099326 [Dendrobium catenatum]|uniref:PAR1 protein n=1 Tax=Dendrobium catenatum TaxID=906689 RepID=A0A2I0WX57_9ASPA|nr:uncharacterized protein LOC110099326 [Dendrobium catenatum]PKU80244.1 hypothetical protein MA16_Dca005775 [Dendrobium catenatum]
MASKALFSLLLPLALFASAVLGESDVTCEKLDRATCAFAVSSSGHRCVLEKHLGGDNRAENYSCRSSGVEAAGRFSGWIETDECVKACGLSRETLGISSDSLLDQQFMRQLCSPECYRGCPNVVELYFNLAAGEGVFLPNSCGRNGGSSRREMAEIKSSGEVKAAPGPWVSFIALPPTSPEKLSAYNNGEALPPL